MKKLLFVMHFQPSDALIIGKIKGVDCVILARQVFIIVSSILTIHSVQSMGGCALFVPTTLVHIVIWLSVAY